MTMLMVQGWFSSFLQYLFLEPCCVTNSIVVDYLNSEKFAVIQRIDSNPCQFLPGEDSSS